MKSVRTVSVEFGDTDPATTVFYPNFFRWFDASTWQLFIDAGLSLEVLKSEFDVIGHPIVDARSKFVKPVFFGDTIEIASFVSDWKLKTFKVNHEVRKDGELHAEGFETRCFVRRDDDDPQRLRAISIPDEIRRRLERSKA